MVYFVDLAVRGRGLDPRLGALTWLLFGLGAMSGTLIGGRAADRWGGAHALKLWLAFQAAALALALPPSTACLFASAFLGGFAGLGVSAVALARARELAGPAAGVVWVRATALYALAQAAAGFCADARVRAHGLTCVRVRPRSCRVDRSVAALNPRPVGDTPHPGRQASGRRGCHARGHLVLMQVAFASSCRSTTWRSSLDDHRMEPISTTGNLKIGGSRAAPSNPLGSDGQKVGLKRTSALPGRGLTRSGCFWSVKRQGIDTV